MEEKRDFHKPIFIGILTLSVITVFGVLKVTASVVLPLTVAILVSLVFTPILDRLNRVLHIPWGLGIVVILLVIAVAIYIISQLLTSGVRTIVEALPKYEERFNIVFTTIADLWELPYDPDSSLINNLWAQFGIRSAVQSFALNFSSTMITFLKDFVMVLLFSFFFLLELRDLQDKLELAFSFGEDTDQDKARSKERIGLIIRDVVDQVTRYISTKFFISLFTGVLAYVGLKVVGQDFPMVWAFLAFVLNFIPNFGSIISVVGTGLFALLQFWPHPGPVIAVVLFMFLVNFILGNIVEPRVQGKNLGLSPFVIIASLSLWGYIWGFLGLVLAVPMMVIVKIICENFSFVRPLSVILGSYTPPEDGSTGSKPSLLARIVARFRKK